MEEKFSKRLVMKGKLKRFIISETKIKVNRKNCGKVIYKDIILKN